MHGPGMALALARHWHGTGTGPAWHWPVRYVLPGSESQVNLKQENVTKTLDRFPPDGERGIDAAFTRTHAHPHARTRTRAMRPRRMRSDLEGANQGFVCLFVCLCVGAGQKVPFDVFVEAQVSRSPGADVGR